jgi:hypothetical protein
MNKIKQIATETFNKLPMDQNNPDKWIDAFVLEYTRAILFEATDVIRSKAREHEPEVATVLKATAIDVLDHFGL